MLRFKSAKINLPLIFIAVLFAAFSANAQISVKTTKETEVPILKELDSSDFQCVFRDNFVIKNAAKFKEIKFDEKCVSPETLKIDFTRQTLIGFNTSGDCFVSADAKVFRRDKEKKYTVRIKNIGGGCRAAGWYQGWLVIEKIPPGFTVEFTETRVDGTKDFSGDNESSQVNLLQAETLETRQIDLKGCIQTIFTKSFIITDQAAFLKTIRNDASRDFCLKNLEKIDFDKNTLIGIELNTGYCREPLFLKAQAVKNAAEKQFILNISYLKPDGTCRALSQYDLWVLVPKLPENYTVKFDASAFPREKDDQ